MGCCGNSSSEMGLLLIQVNYPEGDFIMSPFFKSEQTSFLCACVCQYDVYLYTGSDDRFIYSWSLNSQTFNECFEAHSGRVCSLDYSRKSQRMVSAGDDCAIKIWNHSDILQMEMKSDYKSENISVRFNHDGDVVFSCLMGNTNHNNDVQYWSVLTGDKLGCINISTEKVRDAMVIQDWIVSCSEINNGFKVSKIQDGKLDENDEHHSFIQTDGSPMSVTINCDESKVFLADDLSVCVRSWPELESIATITQGASLVKCDPSNPDRFAIAVVSADETKKQAQVWDVTTNQVPRTLRTLELEKGNFITDLLFTPNGTRLIVTTDSLTITVWDLTNR